MLHPSFRNRTLADQPFPGGWFTEPGTAADSGGRVASSAAAVAVEMISRAAHEPDTGATAARRAMFERSPVRAASPISHARTARLRRGTHGQEIPAHAMLHRTENPTFPASQQVWVHPLPQLRQRVTDQR